MRPVDPDVDLHVASDRAELSAHHPSVLGAISLGGVCGAAARYGVGQLLPTAPSSFPWGTFGINVIGSALIGVLMVVVSDLGRGHRLLRPFLGAGVLGGFTTFSAYAVDFRALAAAGDLPLAAAYLVGSVLVALAAVVVAVWVTRRVSGAQGRPA